MTDNGLAALAAALRATGPDSPYLDGGEHDRQWAAAIIGERGVFLPDGLPEAYELADVVAQRAIGREAQALDDAEWERALETRIDTQTATIATLRAALDGLVAAVSDIADGTEGEQTRAHLRAALAAAKETP
jgi:hypothetical protein